MIEVPQSPAAKAAGGAQAAAEARRQAAAEKVQAEESRLSRAAGDVQALFARVQGADPDTDPAGFERLVTERSRAEARVEALQGRLAAARRELDAASTAEDEARLARDRAEAVDLEGALLAYESRLLVDLTAIEEKLSALLEERRDLANRLASFSDRPVHSLFDRSTSGSVWMVIGEVLKLRAEAASKASRDELNAEADGRNGVRVPTVPARAPREFSISSLER